MRYSTQCSSPLWMEYLICQIMKTFSICTVTLYKAKLLFHPLVTYAAQWLHSNWTVIVKSPLAIAGNYTVDQLCRSGLSNLKPTGHMRPARQYCAACEVIYVLIVLAELMKCWNQKVLYYDLRLNYSTVVANKMGLTLINKILRKSVKTSLISDPSDLTDRCAACGWFKLESPGADTVLPAVNNDDYTVTVQSSCSQYAM